MAVSGGGIPSEEQAIWSSLLRGTTKSSLSAVTSGATGGRERGSGRDGRIERDIHTTHHVIDSLNVLQLYEFNVSNWKEQSEPYVVF